MFLSPPMWEDLEFPVAKGLMGQVCMRPGLSISSEQKVACRLEHMGKSLDSTEREACNRCSKATEI